MDKSDHSFKKPYPVTSQRRKGRVTRLLENGHTSAVFQTIYERIGPLPDLHTPLDTKDQSTLIYPHSSPPTSINTPFNNTYSANAYWQEFEELYESCKIDSSLF